MKLLQGEHLEIELQHTIQTELGEHKTKIPFKFEYSDVIAALRDWSKNNKNNKPDNERIQSSEGKFGKQLNRWFGTIKSTAHSKKEREERVNYIVKEIQALSKVARNNVSSRSREKLSEIIDKYGDCCTQQQFDIIKNFLGGMEE